MDRFTPMLVLLLAVPSTSVCDQADSCGGCVESNCVISGADCVDAGSSPVYNPQDSIPRTQRVSYEQSDPIWPILAVLCSARHLLHAPKPTAARVAQLSTAIRQPTYLIAITVLLRIRTT